MQRTAVYFLARRLLHSSSSKLPPPPAAALRPSQEWNTTTAATAATATTTIRHLFMASRVYPSHLLMSSADDKSVTDGSWEIVTGLEREELEAEKKGTKRFELEPPRGPFGTKEAPAIVQSHFDERIVGCSGGVGDDEHDVVWFKLKKGEPYECPVCTQVFQLEVVGEGGKPGGHHH